MANPYVFIVGCQRSGTTLLRRMVDAHPQIAIMRESHWIPRFFEDRTGLTSEGFVTPELIPELLRHPKFARLNVGEEELLKLLETGKTVPYADFVSGVFDLYGQQRGKSLVGDKTPAYVRSLGTLYSLWPRVRFVHLIRDGRDVCLSVGDWPKAQQKKPGMFATWKDDWVSTTALFWELSVQLGRQAGNLLGLKLYHEIRYESLVSSPAETCAALCAFLGLPYDEAVLRFHEGRTKDDPSLSVKRAWRPITPGLRDWRLQMRAEDVEPFEAAAGRLLDELGYPRAVLRPRPEALEHASGIRRRLAEDEKWLGIIPQARAGTAEPASRHSGSLAKNQVAGGSLEGRAQT